MRVDLSYPDITEEEIEEVVTVLRSQHLSMGPKVQEFEEAFAYYLGRKHGVAVNSGTSGLHLIMKSLNLGPGDEIITTPFSFVASANCILYEGAKPVFVDIDPWTLNLDTSLIEPAITPNTRGILPVDVFGYPLNMNVFLPLAAKHGLALIEDACEAIGSCFRGKLSGSQADSAVFAFYPNKQITTGEGGMIVTDDDRLACLCRSLRNQGRGENGLWLTHHRLGYNYRLDEMSAALGVVQLRRLESIIGQREQVAQMYDQRLQDLEWVQTPYRHPDAKISWFVYVIRLEEGLDRDAVMTYLQNQGIGCRPYFSPIHLQPLYRERFGYRGGEFPITENIASRTLALPFHNRLQEEEVDYVVEQLRQAVDSIKK